MLVVLTSAFAASDSKRERMLVGVAVSCWAMAQAEAHAQDGESAIG